MSHPRSWTIQQTNDDDRNLIAGLVLAARWKHLHLDWIQPQDLAEQPPFLLALESGLPVCCLGCPPDLPATAWVRVFAVASGYRRTRCWEALWPAARERLEEAAVAQVAALVTVSWLSPLLKASAFELSNEVIFLEWAGEAPAAAGPGPGRMRPMESSDLPLVLAIDNQAFAAPWRFTAESVAAARSQAYRPTVLEIQGEPVGYQITTVSALGAHLARVAVLPGWQRQGLGKALVTESMRLAVAAGHESLSVNTQADNAASRKLYRQLGFRETGQHFPVYQIDLAGL